MLSGLRAAFHAPKGEMAAAGVAHVEPLVRSTHERFDGGGYPDGLAGADIPLSSRIGFVCDALDAMTSSRPYRRTLSVGEALGELRRHAGTQFDPEAVEAFVRVIEGEQTRMVALAS
jgi:HD-GYP domain-containing protein (c-di-GMP phosphodiesterase class II)